MNTVLIFGAAGQLGQDCASVLQDRYRLVLLQRADADLTDARQCRTALEYYQPNLVLNCAAYTKVDEAESQPDLARAINTEAPRIMAEWVETRRAWLVHISTDFVFDGNQPPSSRYTENAKPHPLSVYGQTKLDGESAVRTQTQRHTILRTAWLYGHTGHNFPKTMLRLAMTQPERTLRVVNDQMGTPTWSHRLARQIERVLQARATGTFHASSDGACSWYAFASTFLKAMEVPHRLAPCSTADYPRPATRPPCAVLENRALRQAGLDIMPQWEEDITAFVKCHRHTLIRNIHRERT